MEITIREKKLSYYTFHGEKRRAEHESRKYPYLKIQAMVDKRQTALLFCGALVTVFKPPNTVEPPLTASSLKAMFLVTSRIVINVLTRGLLAVETMHVIVRWLANLNIRRNMTSMFVNKKHRYNGHLFLSRRTVHTSTLILTSLQRPRPPTTATATKVRPIRYIL